MTITSVNTDACSIEELSAYIQARLNEEAVLIPTIMDESKSAFKGVKSVEFRRSTKLVAESHVENTDYTDQAVNWVVDVLNLDKEEGVYATMTNRASRQSANNQETDLFINASEALIQKLEVDVYSALAAASAASPDHRIPFQTTDVISTQDILEARRLLNKQFVPRSNRVLAINPDQETDLLDLDKFTDASKYGSNMALLNGEIGRIYGFRVVVTENVTTSTALAYHMSHAVFARQQDIIWETDGIIRKSAKEYLLETAYGLATLDGGKRGVLLNNTGA